MNSKQVFAGNLGAQKYEVTRNIERHLKVISSTPATYETTRWKSSSPEDEKACFRKQRGRDIVEEKRINADNAKLHHRLYQIVTCNREAGTQEYAPGLRIGRGNANNNAAYTRNVAWYVFNRLFCHF